MIGRNLKKYRLINGWSLREMANKLGVSHQTIKKYEDGIMIPNPSKLKLFAKTFKVNVKDLVNSFEVPNLNFQNLMESELKKNQIKGLKLAIEEKIANYVEVLYLSDEKSFFDINKWTFNVKSKQDIDNAVYKVREFLGITNYNPIGNLVDKLEDNDFLIIEIDDYLFSSFSEIVDDRVFIILSSKLRTKNRFYLARELGKIILNIQNNLIFSEEDEIYDYFAYSLLITKESIVNELNKIDLVNIYSVIPFITKKYDVTNEIVIKQLLNFELVDDNKYKKSLNKIKNRNLKDYVMTRERPMKMIRLVFILEIEKVISPDEVTRLLGISSSDYLKLYS